MPITIKILFILVLLYSSIHNCLGSSPFSISNIIAAVCVVISFFSPKSIFIIIPFIVIAFTLGYSLGLVFSRVFKIEIMLPKYSIQARGLAIAYSTMFFLYTRYEEFSLLSFVYMSIPFFIFYIISFIQTSAYEILMRILDKNIDYEISDIKNEIIKKLYKNWIPNKRVNTKYLIDDGMYKYAFLYIIVLFFQLYKNPLALIELLKNDLLLQKSLYFFFIVFLAFTLIEVLFFSKVKKIYTVFKYNRKNNYF